MKAYTLIEVVIAVMILAIILLGGTSLFFNNLRSSGLSDVDLNLTTSLRSTLSAIERDILYSQIEKVGGTGTRANCVSAGSSGFTGDSIIVRDLEGLETTYSVDNNKIASTSAETGRIVYISPADIKINDLKFTWYCQSGVSDKMNIEIDASSVVLGSGINVTRIVSDEVNLLNSGIN